jgi:uncharacterized membrane protein
MGVRFLILASVVVVAVGIPLVFWGFIVLVGASACSVACPSDGAIFWAHVRVYGGAVAVGLSLLALAAIRLSNGSSQ